MSRLSPANAEFVIVSFEGPDEYARAGGLAVRVRDLSEALAAEGFRTHLFFVGDPDLPGVEARGNLTLHRWSQWISGYYPGGVYDGEWGKIQDLAQSLPPFLIEQIVQPAAREGKATVVMAEDWQTVATLLSLSSLLAQNSLLRAAIPVWTANNTYGFTDIPWETLDRAATIMTISKYMKHAMREFGPNPLVTPNGISPASLVEPPDHQVKLLRQAFDCETALFKIGRFSPDKRWMMALEAVAMMKHRGNSARLLVRGDRSAYGPQVLARAESFGLTVSDISTRFDRPEELATAIAAPPAADVLNITSFLPDDLIPVIYAAVDGVLANSGHEPFGLVGLEVMGAGGLAFVGSTGEEYAEPQRNAVVLDTDDPREIVVQLEELSAGGSRVRAIRRRGKETARAYLWSEVLRDLFVKLDYAALTRGVELHA